MKEATIRIENRFETPPDYAAAWLTDFREDDGRFFDDAAPYRIVREGRQIRREQLSDMGPTRQVITLESPTRWSTVSETTDERGGVVLRIRVVETVEPAGSGTLHRVELRLEPGTEEMRAMLPQLGEGMEAMLRKGFGEIRKEMEAASRAGKPATA